jgi:NTE family protein
LLPLLDRTRFRRGLFQRNRLVEYLIGMLGEQTFDQLRLPLALVAVDLNNGKKVVLNQGRVVDAVRASIAFPGLLTPVERGGQLLVDGGLLDNLPADAVRAMGADLVIAVDVSTDEQAANLLLQSRFIPEGFAELVNVLWRSLAVMRHEANRRSLEEGRPDLLIRPAIPTGVTIVTGFNRAAEIIAAGERAMEASLPALDRTAGV